MQDAGWLPWRWGLAANFPFVGGVIRKHQGNYSQSAGWDSPREAEVDATPVFALKPRAKTRFIDGENRGTPCDQLNVPRSQEEFVRLQASLCGLPGLGDRILELGF